MAFVWNKLVEPADLIALMEQASRLLHWLGDLLQSCAPILFLVHPLPLGELAPRMLTSEADTPETDDGNVWDVWQTEKAKESLCNLENNDSDSCKILPGEWSDGMDPNKRNKGNCGSVHVTSFTMIGHKENSNDPSPIFPASIDTNNSNQMDSHHMLCEDLCELREPATFFYGAKMMKVQVMHFLTEQDWTE